MAIGEIKKFNEKIKNAQRLIGLVKEAGGNVLKLVKYARELGYDFSLDELQAESDKLEKTAGSGDEAPRAVVGAAVIVGAVVGPPVVVSAAVAV